MGIRSKKIALIGPMGAGKSTIGQQLAEQLNLPFFDSDREIKTATGADITWIFDVEGEAGFRERERAVITLLAAKHELILATGGGVVLRAENRKLLRSFDVVIYLHASVKQQLERTQYDKTRPLLQTPNPTQVLQNLINMRDPLYRQLADIIIYTDELKSHQIITQILNKIS